ncbi:MAG: hypothetical protein P8K79_02985, partial [Mariniblastus sp.]|nr:hypothetical protein [Mariniblastus sp.]
FQIGPDCSWIDPEVIDSQIAYRAAAMMGIDLQNDPFCQLGDLGDPPTIAPGIFDAEPPTNEPAPGQEPPTSKLETPPAEETPPSGGTGGQTNTDNQGQLEPNPIPISGLPSTQKSPSARTDSAQRNLLSRLNFFSMSNAAEPAVTPRSQVPAAQPLTNQDRQASQDTAWQANKRSVEYPQVRETMSDLSGIQVESSFRGQPRR